MDDREWRAIIATWPDTPEYAGQLKMEVLKIASLIPSGHLPLGQHPRFLTIVKALDHLLMREVNEEVESYLHRIMVERKHQQFFKYLGGLGIDANVADVIASFADGWEGGGNADYSCVIVTLGDGQDAPAYFDTLFPTKGTSLGDILEHVAEATGHRVSQLQANVREAEWLQAIQAEVFVMTVTERPDRDDYHDDINSWPAGRGRAELREFVLALQDRRLEGGTWGDTAEFAQIVKEITQVLVPSGATRGAKHDDDGDDYPYEEVLDFLQESLVGCTSPSALLRKVKGALS